MHVCMYVHTIPDDLADKIHVCLQVLCSQVLQGKGRERGGDQQLGWQGGGARGLTDSEDT